MPSLTAHITAWDATVTATSGCGRSLTVPRGSWLTGISGAGWHLDPQREIVIECVACASKPNSNARGSNE